MIKMSITDDEHELLSNTDVGEESLMDDEKNWHLPEDGIRQRPKKSTFARVFGTYRWLLDVFLVLIIFGLLVLLNTQWESLQPGGDFKAIAPKSMDLHGTFLGDMLIQSSGDEGGEVRSGYGIRSEEHVRFLYSQDSRQMEAADARYVKHPHVATGTFS